MGFNSGFKGLKIQSVPPGEHTQPRLFEATQCWVLVRS